MNTTTTTTDSLSTDFASVRSIALGALDTAAEALNRYALTTDTPAHAAIECADLLDAAREALAGAP